MSDTKVKSDQADIDQETPKPTPPPARDQGQDDGTDWVAEARKWEKRAKENSAAAARLAELEDAQKSAEQRAAAREAAAEKRAAEAESRALRREVALEHSLSREDAALLDDLTDEDAMRRLATRLAEAAEASASPRSPRPNPAQREGDSPAEDKDAIARAFFGI